MEALEGHTVTSYEDSGSTELGRCGRVAWPLQAPNSSPVPRTNTSISLTGLLGGLIT